MNRMPDGSFSNQSSILSLPEIVLLVIPDLILDTETLLEDSLQESYEAMRIIII